MMWGSIVLGEGLLLVDGIFGGVIWVLLLKFVLC